MEQNSEVLGVLWIDFEVGDNVLTPEGEGLVVGVRSEQVRVILNSGKRVNLSREIVSRTQLMNDPDRD